MARLRFVGVFLGMLAAFGAQAASYRVAGVNRPGCDPGAGTSVCLSVLLEGDIDRGDFGALKQFIEKAERGGSGSDKNLRLHVGEVLWNSPGGSVDEAISIGRYLRVKTIGTFVPRDAKCASACVLGYVGGVQRFAAGELIVHSFYSPEHVGTGQFETASAEYDRVLREVGSYLDEMRVSRTLLDMMITTPHYASRTLTFEEAEAVGLQAIDPVYAAVRKPAATPEPTGGNVEGVCDDLASVRERLKRKAEQNDVVAQYCLGKSLLEYRGSSDKRACRDEQSANSWFMKASGAGLPNAQLQLAASAYLRAEYERSHAYNLMAARHGNAEAMYMVGSAYAVGRGVPKNDAEALFWFSLASARTGKLFSEEASRQRDKLEKVLSRPEVSEVQKRAARWKPTALPGGVPVEVDQGTCERY